MALSMPARRAKRGGDPPLTGFLSCASPCRMIAKRFGEKWNVMPRRVLLTRNT